jgi:dolichol kinase
MEVIFNVILLGVVVSFVYVFVKVYRLAKADHNLEGAWNSLGLVAAVILFLGFYIFNSVLEGFPLIPYPFDVLMLGWAGAIFAVQLAFRRWSKTTRQPPEGYVPKEQFTMRRELARKLSHAAILLLIAIPLGVGAAVYTFINALIQGAIALHVSIWGIPGLTFPASHANWLAALFGTLGAFFLLAIPEIFRLFDPQKYLLAPAISLMRASEQASPSAPVILTLAALVPLAAISNIVLPLAALTIAVVGDALASICGRLYGRHKIGFFPAKSYEGLIAGMCSGFVAGFLVLLLGYGIVPAVVLALAGSLVLGGVDLLKISISDNFLNPVLIPLGMFAVASLLLHM